MLSANAQYVRLINFDGIMLLQDCATELCLDRQGKFSLPAEKPKEELYPDSRPHLIFDTVHHAHAEANHRKDCMFVEAVGYEKLGDLKVNQEVLYVAGMGKHHCTAIAEVSQKPGTTGCMIILKEFVARGDSAGVEIGEEIVGGATELFLPKI